MVSQLSTQPFSLLPYNHSLSGFSINNISVLFNEHLYLYSLTTHLIVRKWACRYGELSTRDGDEQGHRDRERDPGGSRQGSPQDWEDGNLLDGRLRTDGFLSPTLTVS